MAIATICKEKFQPNNMGIFLLNLDKSKDRLAHFNSSWKESDMKEFKYIRIPAVDGRNIDIANFVSEETLKDIQHADSLDKPLREGQITFGGVGCFLSHLQTYKKMVQLNIQYALILEDDVVLPKNFKQIMSEYILSLPKTWSIFLLNCHCIKCTDVPNTNNIHRVENFIWTHCYIIKNYAAKFILNKFDGKPITQQFDSELSDLFKENPQIEVYCATNEDVTQNASFETTIQIH